jgi:hypothetical protein
MAGKNLIEGASGVLSILKKLDGVVESGAGANLRATIARLAATNDTDLPKLIRTAASRGVFAGKFNGPEKIALRKIVDDTIGLKGEKLSKEAFDVQQRAASKMPLIFGDANPFSTRMRELGFIPLTGQNYNKPGIVLKSTASSAFPEITPQFTEESARNLIAAYNIDPKAAEEYAKFYPRVAQSLEATGIPMDRVGGAWATMSAQADPEVNAARLIDIITSPEKALIPVVPKGAAATGAPRISNLDDEILSLRFLAGQIPLEEAQQYLGRGKRYNFLMNSIEPSNPLYYTADTRDSQAAQGLINTYKVAPFEGQFDPFGPRYEAYKKSGLVAAERTGLLPNALQAGAWGNIRNFAGKPTDFSEDYLAPLANTDYNPERYLEVLKRLGAA